MPVPDTAARPSDPGDIAGERPCGRCRRSFVVGGDVPSIEDRTWWACPPCTGSLLPLTRVP